MATFFAGPAAAAVAATSLLAAFLAAAFFDAAGFAVLGAVPLPALLPVVLPEALRPAAREPSPPFQLSRAFFASFTTSAMCSSLYTPSTPEIADSFMPCLRPSL